MPLTPGTRLGVYDITAPLGEGGMGQVWRATDTTLGRQVAIKILPDAFAADPDRLARFEREAKTLASLNHPRIAAIHGFEKSSDVQALVMELVEGEDLSQRIARGAIPLDEALPIARQIAEALEAAHEQGIVHRDLKPANVKVRPDGTVKVLDFGLAKAAERGSGIGDQGSGGAANSPTITTPAMTQAGIILGTAAYMSPEQARGKTVDKRADIWAFGAVLYEMLTGTRAFPGEDLTDTLAAVVRAEPDWKIIPRDISPTLLAFLKRSLQKDPKQRVSDIQDMRLALEGAFDIAAASTTAVPASAPSRGRLPMAAVAMAALVIITLAIPAVQHLREMPPPAPPERRLEIVTSATDGDGSFALSPDGRQIVYQAFNDGRSRLWLRSLAETTAAPLAGTDGGRRPFWSPDSRSIGFFADGALKRLDLGGGIPRTLASALGGRGGAWSADGVILFAPAGVTPLMRVSANGSAAAEATTLGAQESGHLFPYFLPDGRRFLFSVSGAPAVTGIYLGALDGGVPTRLTMVAGAGGYLPAGAADEGEDGWLLWVQAGALVAQQLDVGKGALVGEPVRVADQATSISAVAGLVAYRGTAGGRQLTWVDRSGATRGTIGEPDGSLAYPRLSPDGRRVAASLQVQGSRDIWLFDGTRTTRLTFDPGGAEVPLWSPDGLRIVFRSLRTGSMDLYQTSAGGGGGEERLVVSDQTKAATSWSRDGRFVLYMSNDPSTNSDLWVVPTTGDRTPSVVLKAAFREAYGAFSPDGRWVAYHSNESGRNEVYVRPFVAPEATAAPTGGQWQVSAAGGVHPVWRHDGKELFYLDPSGAMMAAPIAVSGTTVAPGAPVRLFTTRIYLGGLDDQGGRQYDVAPDGRFLVNMVLGDAAEPITLIQNWQPPAGQ